MSEAYRPLKELSLPEFGWLLLLILTWPLRFDEGLLLKLGLSLKIFFPIQLRDLFSEVPILRELLRPDLSTTFTLLDLEFWMPLRFNLGNKNLMPAFDWFWPFRVPFNFVSLVGVIM